MEASTEATVWKVNIIEVASEAKRWKRMVLLVAIALTFLGAGLGLTLRKGGPSEETRALRDAATLVVPNTCEMKKLVEAKQFRDGANLFWDRVHTPAHILSALLDKKDKAADEKYLRAKALVEKDLTTLSPNLSASVPAFEQSARSAVRSLGLRGADTPCA